MWTQKSSCNGVGGRIMALLKASHSIPGTCGNMVSSMAKGTLKMRLRNLRWEFILDYPGGPNRTWLGHRERCDGRREKDSKCERDSQWPPLQVEKRGHEPRNEAVSGPQLIARKEKEISVLQLQ